MQNIISFVLGGGRGTRLFPLTKYRAKPAVPLVGKYRLIDIPLSNCVNSGLTRIYVLTQFLSASLHRHIRQAYRFDRFSGGYVEILAAQQTIDERIDWYEGTADAVRKNLRYIRQPGIDNVMILSGDQLYRKDFRDMIQKHEQTGADVTIAAKPVARDQASRLGIMRVDTTGRVQGFLEKPQTEAELDIVKTDPDWINQQLGTGQDRDYIASMGIYLFRQQTLHDVLSKTNYQDFGKEVFPASFRTRHVQVHLFDDYWEDIGTIRSFYEANLSLASTHPPFEMSLATGPIYTRPRYLPPTRMDKATISGSLVADGCKIGKGAVIENSVIGLRCMIGERVVIRNSILMGADHYESEFPADQDQQPGIPPIGIGSGTIIDGAIVDKNCRIGENCEVVNRSAIDSRLGDDCMIVDQIPVVVKEAILPNGWRIE